LALNQLGVLSVVSSGNAVQIKNKKGSKGMTDYYADLIGNITATCHLTEAGK